MLSDNKGIVSSKRVSGIICVLFLNMCLILDTLTCGLVRPSDSLIDVIGLLAFGCLGLTSTETIFGKKYEK